MNWFLKLFSSKTEKKKINVEEKSGPQKVFTEKKSDNRSVIAGKQNVLSENDFLKQALRSSAFCEIPINKLGNLTSDLAREFMVKGISSSEIPDLFGL